MQEQPNSKADLLKLLTRPTKGAPHIPEIQKSPEDELETLNAYHAIFLDTPFLAKWSRDVRITPRQ